MGLCSIEVFIRQFQEPEVEDVEAEVQRSLVGQETCQVSYSFTAWENFCSSPKLGEGHKALPKQTRVCFEGQTDVVPRCSRTVVLPVETVRADTSALETQTDFGFDTTCQSRFCPLFPTGDLIDLIDCHAPLKPSQVLRDPTKSMCTFAGRSLVDEHGMLGGGPRRGEKLCLVDHLCQVRSPVQSCWRHVADEKVPKIFRVKDPSTIRIS